VEVLVQSDWPPETLVLIASNIELAQ